MLKWRVLKYRELLSGRVYMWAVRESRDGGNDVGTVAYFLRERDAEEFVQKMEYEQGFRRRMGIQHDQERQEAR